MKNPIKTKLRIRFVLLAMAALLLLQGMIVFVSIYHNYQDLVEKSDVILSQIRDNPTSSARYFSVKAHPGKGAVRVEVIQNLSVTQEQAAQYAKTALHANADKGFVADYRYHIYQNEDGIRLLFLSRASSLEMHRSVARNLIWVSAAGLGIMGILLSLVSGWVVQPLMENHRRQKAFITAASHQLKTPLSVISADAQLLRGEIGDNQWIDGILSQVEHLTGMTHDLVTLAKAEEYASPVVKEAFPLSDAVADILNAYAGLSENSAKSLHHQIQPGICYRGNENEIRHLLTTLLDNAFKYCPAGGRVCLCLDQEKQGIRLHLSNTATGIDGQDAASLTQRFSRGSNAAHTKGFGLGLSIAEAIAARHGGKLSVSLDKKDLFQVTVILR